MHLLQKASSCRLSIPCTSHESDENDIVENVALYGCYRRHSFHFHFLIVGSLAFWRAFYCGDELYRLAGELALIYLLIDELFKHNHIAVSGDETVVNS